MRNCKDCMSRYTFLHGPSTGRYCSNRCNFLEIKGLERFKVERLVLAMQVSGVGGVTGVGLAHAYDNGTEIYLLPSGGLMGEASIGGQRFSFVSAED